MPLPARQFRLTSPRQISGMFETGARVTNGRMLLLGEPNGLPFSRMAVAVGQRHGKAVQRNRVKRLCREAFRSIRDRMPPGWDVVMVPRARPDHAVGNLAEGLLSLTQRLEAGRPKSSP